MVCGGRDKERKQEVHLNGCCSKSQRKKHGSKNHLRKEQISKKGGKYWRGKGRADEGGGEDANNGRGRGECG